MSEHIGVDLNTFFNQYLRTIKIPILEYKLSDKGMEYRYQNVVANFYLPIKINVLKQSILIEPEQYWKTLLGAQKISFNENYYIEYKEVLKD